MDIQSEEMYLLIRLPMISKPRLCLSSYPRFLNFSDLEHAHMEFQIINKQLQDHMLPKYESIKLIF